MKKFSCEKCFYYTDSKFCFESHKKSKTHTVRENSEFEENFKCEKCNKTYKSKCGFYTHKRKCKIEIKKKNEEEIDKNKKEYEEIKKIIIDLYKQNTEIINKNTEIIKKNNEVIKENSEMKNIIIELSKKENNITNIENNTNSKNKIDINIFLNDKCKNAINMSSLIESIVIGIKDIENIEKHGYVKTITNIVAEKLGDYSIYERPLHYYIENEKNEEPPNDTIHIKENGEWNDEDLYEHDLLLENLNTLNNAFQENTKQNNPVNLVVKNGKRYDRTKKIITNILDNVKINEEQLC